MLTVRQTCHLPSLALPEPTLLSFGTASGGKAIPGSKYGLKNGVDFTLFLWWQMFYPLRRCCQKCTVLRVGIFFVGWNGISKAVVRQRWGVMYFNGVTRVHAIVFLPFCRYQWISQILPSNLDRPIPAIILRVISNLNSDTWFGVPESFVQNYQNNQKMGEYFSENSSCRTLR